MDEEAFNKKLRELICAVASLPADKQQQLAPLVEETKDRHKEIKENVGKINRSLIDLRICLKYLLFDLEATRRERDIFRAMLNNQPPEDDDEPDKAEGKM